MTAVMKCGKKLHLVCEHQLEQRDASGGGGGGGGEQNHSNVGSRDRPQRTRLRGQGKAQPHASLPQEHLAYEAGAEGGGEPSPFHAGQEQSAAARVWGRCSNGSGTAGHGHATLCRRDEARSARGGRLLLFPACGFSHRSFSFNPPLCSAPSSPGRFFFKALVNQRFPSSAAGPGAARSPWHVC